MATATAIDLSALWEALFFLPWSAIPSDLSEIDAHWCYCKLATMEATTVTSLLPEATWDDINGFAQSLRAVWDRAREVGDEFGENLRDW